MWATEYIKEIQKRFISDFGFPENPNEPGIPIGVVDGVYPMTIEGKIDYVRIEDGKINCCNYQAPEGFV